MKLFISALLFLMSSMAQAAQYGKIVVDQANVHEFPQDSSNVVDQVARDDVLVVSNLPTEGFYKVRTTKGQLGWISGNDIFVTKTLDQPIAAEPSPSPSPTEAQPEALAATPTPQPKVERAQPTPTPTRKSSDASDLKEYSRIILAGGLHTLSYSGVPATYQASRLNMGWNGLAELQFKLNSLFFWAIRAEVLTATTGDLIVAAGTTQKASHLVVPVQLGVNFSPLTFRRFRLGLGLYAGMAYSTLTPWKNSGSLEESDTYSSFDPCGTAALQMNIGLSNRMGIFLEAAYRYEKTSNFKAVPEFGGVPAFSADYSGIVGRVGVEFRL